MVWGFSSIWHGGRIKANRATARYEISEIEKNIVIA